MKRIKNILLAFSIFAYALVRGSARKEGDVKKLAIVYPSKNIGDIVCITPLLQSIKNYNRDIQVTVFGSEIGGELLNGYPSIDKYVVLDKPFFSLVRSVRKEKYDAGICINMDIYSLAALFLGNVKAISCLVLEGAKKERLARPYRLASSLAHQVRHVPGTYIPDTFLNLLKPFSISGEIFKKYLAYSREDFAQTKKIISDEETFIAIAPGAGADFKRWPAGRFAEVADSVSEKYGHAVVLIGGPNDKRAVEACKKSLGTNVRVVNPGPLDMGTLKALLSRAILLLGNDSGAIHVAEAVGTKSIAIVGATDDTEHLKQSDMLQVMRGDHSTGDLYQSYIGDESKMDAEHACKRMESVKVTDVLAVVESQLRNT